MTPFLDAVVRFVVAMLFNGLWEAALLAVVAWIALRALPNLNATTRHTLLAAALLASLILPVVTAFITTAPMPQSARTAATGSQLRDQAAALLTPPSHVRIRMAPPLEPPVALRPSVTRPSVTLPRVVAIGLVAAWLLGAVFVLLRLIASLLHLERLKRDALPVPVEYRTQLERWATASKGARTVRLCRSSEIVIPLAVGLFDAMILVPEHLLEDLEPKEIDQIVLHELAHLRRGDDWLNAIERFAQALFFFNPGILWLVAHLDLEREVACDDWVLQQNQALPYATCLAKIVETTLWPHRAMSAPGAFVTRRAMSVRIERLLSKHRDVRVSASIGPTGIVVAALVALCVAAAFVSPSFAYTIVSEPATVATHTSAKPSATVRKTERATPVKAVAVATAAAVSVATATPVVAPAVAAKRAAAKAAAATSVASKTIAAALASAQPPSVARAIAAANAAATAAPVAVSTPAYIDELASVGYTGLTVDELIRLRSVGVTAELIRELAAAGIQHPSVTDLVRIKAMGVDPAFIGAMRTQFGASTSLSEIVSLKAVGVTTDYVDQMTHAGLSNLSLREVRELRALGVTPDYIQGLARAGYPNLTARQYAELRAIGIDGAFVQEAAAHGFHNLTIDQLVRLKTSRVMP